jgi:hypothetical protein
MSAVVYISLLVWLRPYLYYKKINAFYPIIMFMLIMQLKFNG